MKKTELRIGNYLTSKMASIIQVQYIPIDIDMNNYIPIPLTEEWLLKFGFKYRTNTGFDGWYSCPILGESIRVFGIENGWFKYHSATTVIKYVHELQNLYFALTGKELILKL